MEKEHQNDLSPKSSAEVIPQQTEFDETRETQEQTAIIGSNACDEQNTDVSLVGSERLQLSFDSKNQKLNLREKELNIREKQLDRKQREIDSWRKHRDERKEQEEKDAAFRDFRIK